MRFFCGSILSILLVSQSGGQKHPDWPIEPTPQVVPQPMPAVVSQLSSDCLYVIQSNEDVQVLCAPSQFANVTRESGPIRIRGKFVDGGGKIETRLYEKKNVFIVERVAAGGFEILMVPSGKVERRLIGDGTEPIPPPKPDPKPDPKPEPTKSFRVIFVYESGMNMTAAQNAVVYGKVVEDYLNANCTEGKSGWRRRDKDGTGGLDTTVMNELWSAVKPSVTETPCVAVERNGKVEIIPLSATPAEMVATFKKYVEGK